MLCWYGEGCLKIVLSVSIKASIPLETGVVRAKRLAHGPSVYVSRGLVFSFSVSTVTCSLEGPLKVRGYDLFLPKGWDD